MLAVLLSCHEAEVVETMRKDNASASGLWHWARAQPCLANNLDIAGQPGAHPGLERQNVRGERCTGPTAALDKVDGREELCQRLPCAGAAPHHHAESQAAAEEYKGLDERPKEFQPN